MEGVYYKQLLCPQGVLLPKKSRTEKTFMTLTAFVNTKLGDYKAARLIIAISIAVKTISATLKKKAISGMKILGFYSSPNRPSDEEIANEIFLQMLKDTGVVWQVGCTTHSKPVTFSDYENGDFIVNFTAQDDQPIFASTACCSSAFAIYKKDPRFEDQTLQPGKNILYSGYAIYGHSTVFYLSLLKNRVDGFLLDVLTGELFLIHENLKLPLRSPYYTINEGISFYYSQKVLDWLEEKKNPKKHTLARGRYTVSKIVDMHRILKNGGIYCHPQSKFMNTMFPHRLVYECLPMGHLITQAGGLATDGKSWLLEVVPTQLHCTSPLYVGSKAEVVMLLKHLNPDLIKDDYDF